MGIIIQIFGILIIVACVIFALASLKFKAKWVVDTKSIIVYFIAVFAGVVMVFSPRITKLIIPKVGTIEVAKEQAVLDAKQIADIKQRVEAQSATIDLVAKQASEARKLFEDLEDKNELAGKRLNAIDAKLQESTQLLSDLQLSREFTMTVIAAQNDDRKAFDQLRIWADDKSNPFSSRAEQVWNTILGEHAKPWSIGGFTVPWPPRVDPSKLTLGDLQREYENLPDHSYLKPALIDYIWKRQDFSKNDRMKFLIDVMQNDPSLTAVEYAGRFLNSEANINFKPLYVQGFLNWWKENKDKHYSK